MKIWKAVTHLIRFRWRLFIVAFLLWALVHGLPLLTGVLLKEIFNALNHHEALANGVGTLVCLLFIALLMRAGSLVAGFYADFTFTFTVAALLRKNVLTHIFKKPAAKALPKTIGDAISRFRDDMDEIAGFCGWIADLIYRPIFVVICLGIMFSISVKLTLITFIPLAVTMLISNYAKNSVEKYRRRSREATGTVTGFLADIFLGVEVIKTSGAVERVVSYLEKLNQKRQQFSIKDRVYSELLNTIFYNSVFLGTGLILLFAADDIMQGTFTVGDLALFVFYLSWLSEMTHFLGRLMARFRQAAVLFDRTMEFHGLSIDQLIKHGKVYLDKKEDEIPVMQTTLREDSLEKLQIHGLTYVYDHGHNGIQNISFSIQKGTLTVITGEVGSGKSTLLKVILGLLPKQRGEILWNDQPLKDAGSYLVPPKCAYCPQVPRLLKSSIRENILLGKQINEEQLIQVIRQVNFDTDLEQMKDGLETSVGSMGVKLSGGQRQRVALARALIHDCDLFVFDDISSSIDPKTEQQLMENVFVEGKTILAVSHHPGLMRMADHILVMKKGKVICQGTFDTVYKQSEYVRSLCS